MAELSSDFAECVYGEVFDEFACVYWILTISKVFFFFSFPFINSSGSLSSEELKTIIFGVLDSLFLPEVNQDT